MPSATKEMARSGLSSRSGHGPSFLAMALAVGLASFALGLLTPGGHSELRSPQKTSARAFANGISRMPGHWVGLSPSSLGQGALFGGRAIRAIAAKTLGAPTDLIPISRHIRRMSPASLIADLSDPPDEDY
jgi:hypothetical protein